MPEPEPLYLDGGGDPDLAQIDAYLRAHFNARAVHLPAGRCEWVACVFIGVPHYEHGEGYDRPVYAIPRIEAARGGRPVTVAGRLLLEYWETRTWTHEPPDDIVERVLLIEKEADARAIARVKVGRGVLWEDEHTVILASDPGLHPDDGHEHHFTCARCGVNPPETPGLAEVARIMRRHTHDAAGRSVVSYHAGPDTTADCLLCRALVKAGVLTLADIGKGTREAILSEKVKVESVEVVDPRVQAAWCLTSCGCDGRRIASECGIHGGCARCRA